MARSSGGMPGGKTGGRSGVAAGTIDTKAIYDTHAQIKDIVLSYKDMNLKVSRITSEVRENWVGKGRNEFEAQYNFLIRKIEDFGDTLQEIYDALVEAEAAYEDQDDSIRQAYVMSMES